MILDKKYFSFRTEIMSKFYEIMNLIYHFSKKLGEIALRKKNQTMVNSRESSTYEKRYNFEIIGRTLPLKVERKDAFCISCLECENICPTNALAIEVSGSENKEPSSIYLLSNACISCGLCVPVCPTDYLELRKINLDGSKFKINLVNDQIT